MHRDLVGWARARLSFTDSTRTRPAESITAPAELPVAAEEVPDEALSPAQVRHGLRLSIVEGALSNVHIQLTMGAFLTGYALLIGAGEFELGLLGALPFIAQLCQFIGAYMQERLGERRRMVVLSIGAGRGIWGLIALLPFWTGLGSARLPLFLGLVVISQALLGIGVNGWTSWMSDLVPQRQRGSYFGLRNTVISVTTMACSWVAGRSLDQFERAGDEATGYALLFGAAAVCALAGAALLWWQPEPPIKAHARVSLGELFRVPWRSPRFRSFALTAAGWTVVTGIASPFFQAYGLQTLHNSFALLAIMNATTGAVAMLTQPFIGRLQDRYGDKRVLVWSALGVVPLPWGWVFSTPDFLLPLWLTTIFAGVFWPGIGQGLFNLLLDRSDAEGRGAYIASYGMVTGAGTFVAGIVGGIVAATLVGTEIHAGPIAMNHYSILFAFSSLGRLIMALSFARRL